MLAIQTAGYKTLQSNYRKITTYPRLRYKTKIRLVEIRKHQYRALPNQSNSLIQLIPWSIPIRGGQIPVEPDPPDKTV